MNATHRYPGILQLQRNGRWAIDDDELTSGDTISVKFGFPWFFKGRIEHNGREYYFAWPSIDGSAEMPMKLVNGLLAYRT
jgi:hypothetical protein